ncbi:hypothetical protein GCM10010145_34730 [Streptomyces ruber]|uniref:PPM-type phosphatase domain-containing protein n=2 Tax=Streptomyces TaxID=1883 RepID=A0A918ETX7_9ACTN|nr:PP2C family protein-serine/threonine phosphatase [Streptomyces ruber]GGQ61907.1 hypothetical protein GCM10010145_34730 [Streptomyces ruber]
MHADGARSLPMLMAEARLALAVRVRPAGGVRVGGDVHDAVMTPAGPRLLIGDVRGHGPAAAPLAAVVLAAFRDIAATEEDPVRLVRALDARIRPHLGEEDFVTLLLADLRPNEVRLVNCGHPPPLRIDECLVPLAPPLPCPPLGLDPEPQVQRAKVLPHQRLLLHTDGLTDARAADDTFFSLDEHALGALLAPTLDEALDRLLDLLQRHIGSAAPTDDLTLMLLQPAPGTHLSPP